MPLNRFLLLIFFIYNDYFWGFVPYLLFRVLCAARKANITKSSAALNITTLGT